MQYHVYITPSELNRQLKAVVDLPPTSIELPARELEDLIRSTIDPFTGATRNILFKDFTVDSLREVGHIGELPTPAWLASPDTEHAITGHHPMVGSLTEFLWFEFLNSVLSRKWNQNREWKVNDKNLGYPVLELTSQATMLATYGSQRTKLRTHLPKEWSIFPWNAQSHLSIAPPGVVAVPMQSFLEMVPVASNIFPARTHPLFYVALYEFWQYLCKQPIWAHLAPTIMVDENRETPEFSKQSLINLGIGGATYRWSWWVFMSHVFFPRSKALDILAQYYPHCYSGQHLVPRPESMEMDPALACPPPRLRVLHDPYKW